MLGAGKTTLANQLGEKYHLPIYHRDDISWDKEGNDVPESKQIEIVQDIAKQEKWIFEGCRFSASKKDGRLENCDTIIFLNTNRFVCLFRGLRRYIKQILKHAPKNIIQRIGLKQVKYVLWEFPRKASERESIFMLAREKGKNVIILNNKSAAKSFIKKS